MHIVPEIYHPLVRVIINRNTDSGFVLFSLFNPKSDFYKPKFVINIIYGNILCELGLTEPTGKSVGAMGEF